MIHSLFSRLREPVNGLTHYFAALAAVAGLIVLLMLSRADFLKQESLFIYGASLVLMLTSSAAYHLIQGSPQRIQFLRKLDHASIFVLIAGTYTPVCVNLMTGFWQWGMLAIVWAFAILGSVSKIILINTPRWFTATVYLIMGWLALVGINEILTVLPIGALILLALGGIVFTLGALVYITKTMNFFPGVFGFHEMWHIFVIVGCLCHFMLMAFYVAPTPPL